MTNSPGQARRDRELLVQLSETMAALWTRYAGIEPTSTISEMDEDTVTISLGGVVSNFARRTAADGGADTASLTARAYEREALATVGRLTHRQALSMTTHLDHDSDIATDVVKLGGAPRRARLRKPASAGSRY
jgi:hypothetical protein